MKNLNIKDIAKLAGVGITTVSRVINDHPDVKDETRAHVQRIIEEYHYIPNNSARNLKRLESMDIGIFIKGIFNPFFAKMIQNIEEIFTYHGYSTILHYNTEANRRDIDAVYEFCNEKKLIGLICLGGDFESITDYEIERLGVPLILTSTNITSDLNSNLFSSICIDNEKAAFIAVDYLCKMGHREIGIITTGEGDKSTGTFRTLGYMNALKANEIKKNDNHFEVADYSFERAYEAAQRLLNKSPEISAIFAISDIMAIGASKAILDQGLKIPDNISIIGFDDIDYAAYYNPALTTIRQPIELISKSTAEMMIDLLNDQENHRHEIFETSLIKRNSCRFLSND